MRKIKYILVFVLCFLAGYANVNANSINNMDIDIYIDKDGTAHITEIWETKGTDGTEWYKTINNTGNSVISDFKVTENGIQYETISWTDSWIKNKTLSDKKNKSGIHYTSSGLELCFGKGSYGSHTYKLEYKVTNFIVNTDDAQVLYWTIIGNATNKFGDFTITIYGDTPYDDTLDVWGYGYKGLAYVADGKIELTNDTYAMSSNNYVTLLVKYPLNTFNTTNKGKLNTFNKYYDMSKKGSFDYDYDDGPSFLSVLFSIIMWLFNLSFVIFGAFFMAKKGESATKRIVKNPINKKEVGNYRDIPCNKDIYLAYFLSQVYELNNEKGDLLGAIFLKWLKSGQITLIPRKDTLFSKDKVDIDLRKPFAGNFELESELYSLLYKASKDGVLEKNELKRWCQSNYSKFLKWFDTVIEKEIDILLIENKISLYKEANLFSKAKYKVEPILEEEAKRLIGLKNFLEEFSRINERTAIEVNLWEEYLMFAQIFGIAEKVANQFKKLYPDVIDNTNYQYNYSNIIMLNSLSRISYASARSARSAARMAANGYSAGGGGFSSGGGGGGSFGGGSFGSR